MKLVLFDLDDTLIKGDSAKLWLKFCVQKGFLAKENLQKIDFYQEQYAKERLNMSEFMDFFLEAIKERKKAEIDVLVDEFIKEHIVVYEKAKELIQRYKKHRCIVISATADFLVSKISAFIGIQESIAINCELIDGKFSGKTKGVYSFREGKVLRLKEYLKEDYEALMQDSYFFSDSMNDLALLECVSKAFVCNANKELLELARKRKYEILNF